MGFFFVGRIMKIAVVQIENTLSIKNNFETIKNFIIKAYENSSDIIVFPESALTGYTSDIDDVVYVKLDNEYLIKLEEISIRYNIEIFVGANLMINDELFNSYLYIYKKLEYYHKTHLGKNEKEIFNNGSNLNLFKSKNALIGVAICIESHIPEIFTTHRLNGAKIIITPFASPIRAGDRKEIWHKYLLARAYDNGVFIIANNLVGKVNKIIYSGGLLIADQNGEILKEQYSNYKEIMFCEIKIDNKYQDVNFKKNYIVRREPNLYRRI